MTNYKVHYSDYAFPTKNIEANGYKESALIYFNRYPRYVDCWIIVNEKGFLKSKNKMWFRTAELLPNQIQIEMGNANFDVKKLDSYSLKRFEFIQNNHPNWLQNIVISPNLPEHKLDGFTIRIPNNFQNYYPIEIEIYDGDGSIIYFGHSWYDWYELRNVSGLSWSEWKHNEPKLFYNVVEQIVNDIISEKLISANAMFTEGLGSVNGLFLTKEEYKLTKEQNTLLQAISWRGTYNYQKYS